MSRPFRGHFAESSSKLWSSTTSSPRDSWMQDSPYPISSTGKRYSTISNQLHLAVDPREWSSDLFPNVVEADDFIHNNNDAKVKPSLAVFITTRGLANVGCIGILIIGIIALFAGYPMYSYFTAMPQSTLGGFNLGGTNASGQIPTFLNYGLIDNDTPTTVYTKKAWYDSTKDMQLVFSDEFNTDGRSFYPGDDPYWTAVDLHYWQTNNMEWYDPAAITTADGSLVITLSEKETHGLNYQGGLLTSWNQFCFTGGLIETSVSLPGVSNVEGLWPAIWAMGNLGRAGYGASLDGMWPYSYDSCDIGTLSNQTLNDLPTDAVGLSYLPGQRLSRCTCDGQSHPGPKHADGTFVGRAAPEIDVFEAQVAGNPPLGHVSQSAQWAPFGYEYSWDNTSANLIINDATTSTFNTYLGSVYQQSTSVLTDTEPTAYTGDAGDFTVYGFEYSPGFDGAYISWIANNKLAWTMLSDGMRADSTVNISARPVPQEPMYLLANLGISENFGDVDLVNLVFPAEMRIDYIRVYQRPDAINIGCSPANFPTADYIATYSEAYTNPNLTTWVDDYGQSIPNNSLLGQC